MTSSSPPPRVHPQLQPQSQEARLPAEASGTWDFFFRVNQDMMSPTLSQPEEDTTWPQKREVEQDKMVNVKTTPPPRADVHRKETLLTPTKLVNEQPPSPSKPVEKVVKNSVAVELQSPTSAGATEFKKNRTMFTSVNLIQILIELDDHFLKASETAQEVTKMLETTRLHYHSNFADNRGKRIADFLKFDISNWCNLPDRFFLNEGWFEISLGGHIDHSAMLMRVITWNRSFKGISQEENALDDFDNDVLETHATILGKMLAWEKKLFDEVKVHKRDGTFVVEDMDGGIGNGGDANVLDD
ncbi:hypothetical protein ZIOFF_027972 [Zingiber officinale]|uniref:DUF632 domain-containing protein n=1 Tax=Zingiber officinale TaxID=94328 RepID=A0A8J5GTQ0_ZINOF|nr:hypothetical protein ZIOFF_027972 [Zingiber officinale]